MAAPPPLSPQMEAFIELCSQNKGLDLIGAMSAFITLTIVVLALRVYVRLAIAKAWGWDDATMCASLAVGIVTWGLQTTAVRHGIGEHIMCIPLARGIYANKLNYIATTLAPISLMFSRISICLLLLRLFSVNRGYKIFIWCFIVIIITTNIATAAIVLPECTPLAKLWDPMLPGSCWAPGTSVIVGRLNGGISVACDAICSLLPSYFLYKVQLSMKTKVGVCIIMGLGLFTAGAALGRTIILEDINGSDPSYSIASVIILASVETDFAIIAGSIPALRTLFTRALAKGSSAPGQYERNEYSKRHERQDDLFSNVTNSEPPLYKASATSSHARGRRGDSEDELIPLEQMNVVRKKVEITVS